MKAMKLMMMAVVTVLMGSTLLTSCLDSDSEMAYDLGDYVTLVSGGFGDAFKCDNYPYTIYATNATAIFGDNLPERAVLYFKLSEGEVFTEDQTTYYASIYTNLGYEIYVKDFCNRTDTLDLDIEQSQPFQKISGVWPSGNYLNLVFTLPYTSKTTFPYFNVFPTRAEGDKLYVTLHNDEGKNTSYIENVELLMNFRIPSSYRLISMLGSEEYDKLDFFGANNDSINLVVETIDYNGSTISSSTKVRIIQ